jgi:hypothetical protein
VIDSSLFFFCLIKKKEKNNRLLLARIKKIAFSPTDMAAAQPSQTKKKRVCSNTGCTSDTKVFKKCGNCLTALYCGQACQTAHWPVHSSQCYKKSPSVILAMQVQRAMRETLQPEQIDQLTTTLPLDLVTYMDTLTAVIGQKKMSHRGGQDEALAMLLASAERLKRILSDKFLLALFFDADGTGLAASLLPPMLYAGELHVRPSKANSGSLGLFTDQAIPRGVEVTMHGMQGVMFTVANIDELSSYDRRNIMSTSASTGWIATSMCHPDLSGRMDQTRQNVHFANGISAICAYYPKATDENRMWLASMAVDPALSPGAIAPQQLTYAEFAARSSENPQYFADLFHRYNEIIRQQCNTVLCDHDTRNYCSLVTTRAIKAGEELLVPFGFPSFVQGLPFKDVAPNYLWVSVMMSASLGISTTTDDLRNAGLPCKGERRTIVLPVDSENIKLFFEDEKRFFLNSRKGTCACPSCLLSS